MTPSLLMAAADLFFVWCRAGDDTKFYKFVSPPLIQLLRKHKCQVWYEWIREVCLPGTEQEPCYIEELSLRAAGHGRAQSVDHLRRLASDAEGLYIISRFPLFPLLRIIPGSSPSHMRATNASQLLWLVILFLLELLIFSGPEKCDICVSHIGYCHCGDVTF